ncbi:MAG: COG4315 family predicted lipoprotein [Solirubrobacterales bacterium]
MVKHLLQLGAAAVVLGGASCGGDDSSPDGSAARSGGAADAKSMMASNTQRAAPGLTIKTAASQFGKALFSKGDRAIYYFDKESTSKPECYGACARAWPPVLTKGKPKAAGRVKQGLLGTRKRSNGHRQVTYDGHPLYFYVDDPEGEVLCHNVEEFGGLWLAVKPSGKPVP